MAWTLVRLKARLLANAFARSTQAAIGLILAAMLGVIAALAVLGVTALGIDAGVASWTSGVVLLLTVVWLGWVLVPLLTFSADETLDPHRLELLPLRPRQLVPGMTLAGFVGIAPAATTLALLGVVIGAGRAAGSLVAAGLALLLVAALLVSAVAISRGLAVALANVLASRRGRELAAALLGVVLVGGYALFVLAPQVAAEELPAGLGLGGLVGAARWSPGGLAGRAVGSAAAGEPLRALPVLAALVGLAGLGVLLWTWALGRVDRRPAASRGGRGRVTTLYPPGLRWLPRTRTTAVAMRFLRGLARDQRVRSQAAGTAMMILPIVFLGLTGGVLSTPRAPLLAAYVVLPIALVGANGLALDGPALWQHEVAGAAPAKDLWGRTLALALLAAPVLVAATLALAVAADGWAHLPAALLLGVAVFALTAGVAALTSVLLPVPVPDRGSNPFGNQLSGQGCINSFGVMVVLLLLGVLTVPMILAALLPSSIGVQVAASVACVLYGGGVLVGGVRLAAAQLHRRGPDVLVVVDPGAA